jgi:hypothetical protein
VCITKVEVRERLALACGGCEEIILVLGPEQECYDPGADDRPRSYLCGGCATYPRD